MRILIPIAILLLLAGCRKTKLKDEYSIFEGKWKWIGATETRTSFATGSETYFYHDASDYPDAYLIEFDRKGKIRFYKNEQEELTYRTVLTVFVDNCYNFSGCHLFGMRLDNDKDKPFAGYVGYDTLLCGSKSTNLPLIFHMDNDYEYSYQYKFAKIN